MRGRSYSPSPPRGYGRRGRSPSPRGGRYGGRSRDDPTTLLVRNLRHDCRGRGGRNYDRRGTPPRYHNSPRYSRSPPPRGRDYYSPPKRRQYSRSVSPEEKRYSRERSYSPRGGQGRAYSQSPPREQSPPFNGSRSHSQSPVREHSPPYNGSRSRSRSPVRARSPVRGHSRRQSPSQGHSRSPDVVHYSRNPDHDVPTPLNSIMTVDLKLHKQA
ncbi:hypothetical protein H5410_058860 [Solanum commersonii]|uniref:Uncharacterized protein n=1 Tax=Solanum commersonii TaxID=4109 RepID=A0A9J5W1Q9_SOLCO|nr:hypothetical protein H5410_058860 [Solanum commersonii]